VASADLRHCMRHQRSLNRFLPSDSNSKITASDPNAI
jgi:hypothetical protein